MARRTRTKRLELFSEKLMDWGNLVFIGSVIGQLVPKVAPIQWGLFFFGVCGIIIAYSIALQLMKGGR